MSDHAKFYLALTVQPNLVPEQPQHPAQEFTRYIDALTDVTRWAAIIGCDLTPMTNGLHTVTGDGSKGIGATELAVIMHGWLLGDGRHISLYQVKV